MAGLRGTECFGKSTPSATFFVLANTNHFVPLELNFCALAATLVQFNRLRCRQTQEEHPHIHKRNGSRICCRSLKISLRSLKMAEEDISLPTLQTVRSQCNLLGPNAEYQILEKKQGYNKNLGIEKLIFIFLYD